MLWPLIVLALRRRTLLILSAAIIVTSPVLRIAAWEFGLTGKQIYVLTPFRLDGLAGGAMVACIVRSAFRDRWVMPRIGGALIVIGLSLFIGSIVIAGDPESEGYLMSITGYSGSVIASLGLLIAALSLPGRSRLIGFLSSSAMRMLGKYSYALYLVHLPLRALIRDRFIKPEQFGEWPGGAFVGQIVFDIVSIALALVVAIASWYLIESPAQSLKRFFPNVERSSAVGVPEVDPAKANSASASPLGHTTTG